MSGKLQVPLLAMMLVTFIISCKPSLTDNITSTQILREVTLDSPLREALTVTADVVIQADAVKQPILAEFAITPSFIWLNPYEEVVLAPSAFDQYNQPFADFEILWELSEGIAGTIDQDGNFTAGASGGYFSDAIIATATQVAEGAVIELKAQVAVLVEQPQEISEFAGIQVVPGDLGGVQGQLLRLMAFGLGDSGLIIPDVLFAWEVVDPSWGKLVGEDTVKILAPVGEYDDVLRVTGNYGDKEIALSLSVSVTDPLLSADVIRVQILPSVVYVTVGETYHFDAIALDRNGEQIKNVDMSWEANSNAGQLLDDGVFKAGDIAGVYADAVKVEVSQIDGDQRFSSYAYATVIVEPVVTQVLANVSLLPSSSVVAPGQLVQYRVYAFDEDGGLIPGVTARWEVDKESIGVVSGYGRFTANASAGHYPKAMRVVVSHDGLDMTATSAITITGSLAKAVIWPTEVELAPGDIVLFRATGLDENYVEISSLIVDFRLNDPNAGSITPFGYFIAGDFDGDYKAIVEARVVHLLP